MLAAAYVMIFTVSYHLYKWKNVKNTHGGMLLFIKLQTSAYNFTKSNTPPWVFFTFFKLYKCYEIAQTSHTTINPSPIILQSWSLFWDFLILYEIVLSPQVKEGVIISNKYGIYKLSHKLSNNLRLRILGNWEKSGNFQNFKELYPSAQSSSQNETFVNTSKKILKNKNWTFPLKRYFIWKPEFASEIFCP